jgi:hypothetical protein
MKSYFQLAFALILASGFQSYAQKEREIPPPQAVQAGQDSDFGAKFFEELRRIFGRFRDADLQRVFQAARPIKCVDLVTDKGEWREVAFFNEDRKLGDWYRTNLDEVKADLSVYIFKGGCGGQRAAVQVTTKFPVEDSLRAYQDGRTRLRDIDVNVNAPVSATFDSQTQAYTFDLPYLFRVSGKDGNEVYSLQPRHQSDTYAPDVTNRWQCKAVAADDVTYQFLICRANLLPRNAAGGIRSQNPSFGSSAYSILSDGKEASSSVKLSFGDNTDPNIEPPVPPARSTTGSRSAPAPDEPPAVVADRLWKRAPASSKLSSVGEGEFRLRFNQGTWKGRIGQAQWIADGAVAAGAAPSARNKDYCSWRARSTAEAPQLLDASKADSIIFSLGFRKEAQGTSATFEMQAESGASLGSLQCSFSKTQTPSDITVAMWESIVGQAVELQVPGQ